jgi:hypothetical protein
MLFDMQEIEQKLDWDIVPMLKGQHDRLKLYFPDQDAPYWAFVGNENWIITRSVDGNTGKVFFSIYERNSFIWGTYKYLKDKGEMDKYWQSRATQNKTVV